MGGGAFLRARAWRNDRKVIHRFIHRPSYPQPRMGGLSTGLSTGPRVIHRVIHNAHICVSRATAHAPNGGKGSTYPPNGGCINGEAPQTGQRHPRPVNGKCHSRFAGKCVKEEEFHLYARLGMGVTLTYDGVVATSSVVLSAHRVALVITMTLVTRLLMAALLRRPFTYSIGGRHGW